MNYYNDANDAAIPLIPLSSQQLPHWLEKQEPYVKQWLENTTFKAKAHSHCLIPAADGQLKYVLVGLGDTTETNPSPQLQNPEHSRIWSLGSLPTALKAADYRLDCDWSAEDQLQATIGWGLGAYRFQQYRKQTEALPRLCIATEQREHAEQVVQAITITRDMINTPANDMMPQHISAQLSTLAEHFGAQFREIVGDQLLTANYPAIHAVGRASVHPPRFLELRWGDKVASDRSTPLITLVGKGISFDSGGLDLKPSRFMRQMKKDMGGAAHVIGAASMIMASNLPVRLRVLIAAAENAVSSNAFRPGDVIQTRAGKHIEIDNTDAEGRLVLCDILSDAADEKPNLLIDFATLTGAARVAVGTEVPAFFSNNESLAAALQNACQDSGELIWRLPLHRPYFEQLKSDIADMQNSSASGYGGAITAALYLQEFVPTTIPWAHFDMMAWNNRARPGRPKGGEAMGLLTLFRYLQQQYVTP